MVLCHYDRKFSLTFSSVFQIMTPIPLLGEGNGNPFQYSCLENPMDGGAWCRLLSMGLQRVGHN